MEQGTLFSMIEKFNKVEEVNGLQAYDEYDQKHLQSLYRVYLAERKFLSELKTVQGEYDTVLTEEKKLFYEYFFSTPKGIDTSVKAFCETNQRLIQWCISYLQKRHGCTIPNIESPDRRIQAKDRWSNDEYNFAGDEIRLEDVADRIRVNMGGVDFASKRIQEIKQKFRESFGRRNHGVTQKSNTLSFERYYSFYEQGYCDKNHYRMKYNYHEEASALASGIRLFGGDSQKASWTGMFPEEGDKDKVFAPITIWNVKGVSSLRFFKNGRIDIKFDDAKVAAEFARFFGFTIDNAKEAS